MERSNQDYDYWVYPEVPHWIWAPAIGFYRAPGEVKMQLAWQHAFQLQKAKFWVDLKNVTG